MKLKTLESIKFKDKAVIVRVDFNVPLLSDGVNRKIADDTGIRLTLPTLRYILGQKPRRVIILSHLGRPKGKDKSLSLEVVAHRLQELLKKSVSLVKEYQKASVRESVRKLSHGEVLLFENLRFYKEEENNSRRFTAELAQLGEVFVQDGFGACHRAHASVVGVAEKLPAVAGKLVEKEVMMLDKLMNEPKRPFVAVIGGAKATTKIPMIEKLMTKADDLLLGGGVANTFLKAFGYNVGRSMYSHESVRIAQNLIWKATRVNTNLFMPSDVVMGSLAGEDSVGEVLVDEIPRQFMALDIGRKTRKDFTEVISRAKTIIWNGPMGVSEITKFSKGTNAVYEAIVGNKNALSLVGGGDTLVSISKENYKDKISHISTGGGAMLEYIEKGTLPGLEVVRK